MDKKIKNLLKILISICLLVYVIYTANLSKIIEVFIGINLLFFSVAILVGIFNVALSSKKWQILLKVKEERHRFKEVWKFYYIGIFFNMFLPTSIGGDVVKAYKMSKATKKPVEAYSSVFMERFTGAIAILILAVVATTIYFDKLPIEIPLLVYCLFTPLLIIITILISKKKLIKKLRKLYSVFFRLFASFSLDKKAERLYDSINLYKKEKKVLLIVLIMSFLFQTILIINNFILSRSIDMGVPIHFFFIFIPISVLIAFLPISIRGIGVLDVLYMYFFPMVGATTAEAVSLAFLTHAFVFVQSIIGGVIYLFSNINYKDRQLGYNTPK